MLRQDSATEASFFIAADALLRLQPGTDNDVTEPITLHRIDNEPVGLNS
jgi:hypothetical protein